MFDVVVVVVVVVVIIVVIVMISGEIHKSDTSYCGKHTRITRYGRDVR